MAPAKKPAAAAKSAAAAKPTEAPKAPAAKAEAPVARSAVTLEEATEVGFFGFEVDPTPDEHYTVAGVLAGRPTPETDEQAAAAAKETKP